MYKNILLLIFLTLVGLGLFQMIDYWVEERGKGKQDLSFTQQLVEPESYRSEFLDVNDTRTHIIIRVCVQCHDVPTPKAHTAGEWPAVVSKMLRALEEKQRANPTAQIWTIPTAEEREQITAYLSEYAKPETKDATPDE